MTASTTSMASPVAVPRGVLTVFRGVGQVFFQENALTGALFVLGIALSSPLMAAGAVVGAVIGTATAWVLKYDKAETSAGIYGFNATLVGIATLFFFKPGVVSLVMLLLGCIVATVITRLARQFLPFPTYTGPFIVTTWAIFLLGKALGVAPVDHGEVGAAANIAMYSIEAVTHGIGQVMFQGSIWTGLLFLAGIAVNDWRHAAWVLIASILGMLAASYHATAESNAIHIERLFDHTHGANVALGLYGYNATLTAIALLLWRRSLIPILLGVLLSVPITELLPILGLPALTAPFVLATWVIMAFAWLDSRIFGERSTAAS